MSVFQKLSTVLTKLSIENPWYKGFSDKTPDNIPTFGLPSIHSSQLDIGTVRVGNLTYTYDTEDLYLRQNIGWKKVTEIGAGTGDVSYEVTPGTDVTVGDVALFKTTNGKTITGSKLPVANIVTYPGVDVTPFNLPIFDGPTGRILKDSGITKEVLENVGIVIKEDILLKEFEELLEDASNAVTYSLNNLSAVHFTAEVGTILHNTLTPVSFYTHGTGVDAAESVVIHDEENPSSSSSKAVLEIKSDAGTFLLSRLTTTAINDIGTNAVAGMVVYDKTVQKIKFYNGEDWVVLDVGASGTGDVNYSPTSGLAIKSKDFALFHTNGDGNIITGSGLSSKFVTQADITKQAFKFHGIETISVGEGINETIILNTYPITNLTGHRYTLVFGDGSVDDMTGANVNSAFEFRSHGRGLLVPRISEPLWFTLPDATINGVVAYDNTAQKWKFGENSQWKTLTDTPSESGGIQSHIAKIDADSEGLTADFPNNVWTGTWTVPEGVTHIKAIAVGGGGGGGGCAFPISGSLAFGRGGGGGGSGTSIAMIAVTPGEELDISLGMGGLGGCNPERSEVQGGNGAATYISREGVTICKASGGFGGDGYSTDHAAERIVGGDFGWKIGAVGDVFLCGQTGFAGGRTEDETDGEVAFSSGTGGKSWLGGGGKGILYGNDGANGFDGIYGGGGSGFIGRPNQGSTKWIGGNGGAGVILIEYFTGSASQSSSAVKISGAVTGTGATGEDGISVALNFENASVATLALKSELSTYALLSNVYTKSQVYTKTEVDDSLEDYALLSNVYTKSQIDTSLANYALLANVYTKSQIDTSLASYALLADVYTKTQVYTKTEADTATDIKIDAYTVPISHLAGYPAESAKFLSRDGWTVPVLGDGKKYVRGDGVFAEMSNDLININTGTTGSLLLNRLEAPLASPTTKYLRGDLTWETLLTLDALPKAVADIDLNAQNITNSGDITLNSSKFLYSGKISAPSAADLIIGTVSADKKISLTTTGTGAIELTVATGDISLTSASGNINLNLGVGKYVQASGDLSLTSAAIDGNINLTPTGTGKLNIFKDIDLKDNNITNSGDININDDNFLYCSKILAPSTMDLEIGTLSPNRGITLTSTGTGAVTLTAGLGKVRLASTSGNIELDAGTAHVRSLSDFWIDPLKFIQSSGDLSLKSTAIDGSINLTPTGTGGVVVATGKTLVADTLNSSSASQLTLQTGFATGITEVKGGSTSGSVKLTTTSGASVEAQSGSSGSVLLTPSTTGSVTVAATKILKTDKIDSSTTNGDITLASGGTGNVVIAATKKIKSDIIESTSTNNDIFLNPNGTGSVVVASTKKIKSDIIESTSTNADITLTPNGTGNVVVDSTKKIKTSKIESTSDLTLTSGAINGSVLLTPTGTGSVVVASGKKITSDTIQSTTTNGDITLVANGTGKVSIPSYVEITGNKTLSPGTCGYLNASGNVGSGPMGTPNYSLKCNDRILVGSEINATSSQNIKNIKGRIKKDSFLEKEALALFLDLPFYAYTYKDKRKHGESQYFGLIAEETRKIIPHVVSNDRDIVPNIMQDGTFERVVNQLRAQVNVPAGGLSFLKPDDQVRVIFGHTEGKFFVDYVVSDTQLYVLLEEEHDSFFEKEKTYDAFVYGSEDDCPAVAKERIFELGLVVLKNLLARVEKLENTSTVI